MTSLPDTSDDVPRLPNTSQRLAVIGRTGSGKTVAGIYHLSRRNLRKEKWVIFNFKGDALIDSIERARHVELDWRPPRGNEGGIFIVHPSPHDKVEIEEFLWRLWDAENIGCYADEGYMLSNSAAFEALLTQGRSKKIPMINCTQRPVWVSRFVFSESDFYQVFDLNDVRDWQTVEAFMPRVKDEELPEYYSWYYDVGRKKIYQFSPVPEPKTILATINAQLFSRKI